jgi:hypothetical protein
MQAVDRFVSPRYKDATPLNYLFFFLLEKPFYKRHICIYAYRFVDHILKQFCYRCKSTFFIHNLSMASNIVLTIVTEKIIKFFVH